MSRRHLFAFLLALSLSAGGLSGARAQSPATDVPPPAESVIPASYDTPPALTRVDGTVRLIRQGQAEVAVENMPLVEGDRLVTDNGRAAVLFPDGSWLHLDSQSSVDFLSLSLMRLLDGRLIFGAAGRGGERPSRAYQIDAAAGSVQVQSVGEYRVSTYSDGAVAEMELAVITGLATLMNERGNVEVSAGERSWAREGNSPEFAQAFNSARLDAFDRWSEAERGQEVGARSTQYLPADLYAYSGEFDRNGSWENVAPYGYVWYPRVAATWRPYYDGYWDWVGPYGWTWIGGARWGWPTHHFGRWGFQAGLWFWIPGRRWAPAWVSWGFSTSYLSWCPLDFYNRPIVNIFFGNRFRHGYNPWNAWTVVPRQAFGRRLHVARYALAGARLPSLERTRFAIGRVAPDAPRAVARAQFAGSGVATGVERVGGGAIRGGAVPRALSATAPSQFARARSRDAFPMPSRASARGVAPGSTTATSRGFARPPASSPGFSRPSAPGSATPRGYDRPSTSSPGFSRPSAPGSGTPRGYDRPSTSPPGFSRPSAPRSATPRGYDRPSTSSPGFSRPSAPGSATPRGYDRPSAAPTYSPRYSAPRSAPDYSPRYSAPPSRPEYSPRYSAPGAPGYSRPAPSAAPRGFDRPSMPSSAPVPRAYSPSGGPRPGGASPRGYSAPPSRGPGSGGPSRGPAAGAPSRGPAQSAPAGRAQSRGGRGR